MLDLCVPLSEAHDARGVVDEGRWRVAQAFDFAGITNRMGAPSFAFFAKGGRWECLPELFDYAAKEQINGRTQYRRRVGPKKQKPRGSLQGLRWC